MRSSALQRARTLFDFPEVAAIGFGYTQGGKRGSGVGSYMTTFILGDTAGVARPAATRRSTCRRDSQLLSAGIGPDRVSDIAANVLSDF